jgi:hypothetical protein
MLLMTLSLALAQDVPEDASTDPEAPEPEPGTEEPEPAPDAPEPAPEPPEPAPKASPQPAAEEAFEQPEAVEAPRDKRVRSVSLAESPRGFGVGVILGDPTGISAGWRPDPASLIDGALAWSIPNNSFEAHADYQHTLIEIRDPNAESIAFPVAVGGGLKFASQTSRGNTTPIFGVRVPVMMSVVPDTVPIDGFLEIAPVLELYPGTRLTADASLGARVWFD